MEVPLALVALVIQFPRGFKCPYNGGFTSQIPYPEWFWVPKILLSWAEGLGVAFKCI